MQGDHRAAGIVIRREDLVPGLAAVDSLVNATLLVTVPQVAESACVNRAAILGIDEDAGDALGIRKAGEGPIVTAVGRLIDSGADGDAVARPCFASADPDGLRIIGLDRHSTDR